MTKSAATPNDAMSTDMLRSLLMQAPVALACVDAQGNVQTCNERFHGFIQEARMDAEARQLQQIFPSLDAARWGMLLNLLESESLVTTREVLGSDRMHCRTLELSLSKMQQGDAHWIAVYARDVEEQHKAEGIQLLQNEVLEAVALGRPNRTVMDLLCRRVEALAPDVICTVLLVDMEGHVHPCAAPSMPSVFSEAIDGEPIGPKAGSCGTAAWRGEPVEVTDIANDPLWEDYKALALPLGLAACWSTPIKLRDGRVAGTFALYYREPRAASPFHRQMVEACVHLCSLAIEHEESEQQIHQLAFYDPLTKLANRSLLRDRAQQALARVERERKPLALLFLDLDRFKTINDSLGHHMGDRLLKTIAHRLQHCLKPNDTVARLGGDEFVLLLPETGEAQARVIAEKLMLCITEPLEVGNTELTPTVSIGISIAPDDANDFETLQKNADVAMYQAKAAGRNTYRFFQSQMNEAATERLEMETALRRAIADKELTVHYQPQIGIAEQNLYGLEALVRWQHPQWGLVSPMTFIPLAEETGLIGAIDHFVMQEVCRQLARWHKLGLAVKSVAVNLSVADFHYADVADRVRSLLQQYQLAPECLTLEITESLMLNSVDETLATLRSLRDIGVKLSVDDFGTGYSSLSYLKRFPINELKLDRSFVRDLADDPSDRALASAIIQLGETFNHTVVAEGVETLQQLEFLTAHRCAVAQGFYFARPMPADEMTAWLQGPGKHYLGRVC